MPCDQVRYQSVSFDGGSDLGILKIAMENAGYAVQLDAERETLRFQDRYRRQGTFQNGKFNVQAGTMDEETLREFKREYSKEALARAAKRFGWNVKNKTSAQKFTLARRTV